MAKDTTDTALKRRPPPDTTDTALKRQPPPDPSYTALKRQPPPDDDNTALMKGYRKGGMVKKAAATNRYAKKRK